MRRARGFTLIELVVASGIITIGFLGLAASLAASIRGAGTTDDTRIALAAIHDVLEDMRAADPATLFATYAGRRFAVAGLRESSAGGPQGAVAFLTEADAAAALGCAAGSGIDLDWNGIANEAAPPAATWSAFAVRVSVLWGDRTLAQGDRAVAAVTIIFGRGG